MQPPDDDVVIDIVDRVADANRHDDPVVEHEETGTAVVDAVVVFDGDDIEILHSDENEPPAVDEAG